MKTAFTMLMVAFCCSLRAQTTITVTIPQNVATKEWAQKYIQEKVDSIKAATPPVVSLPSTPCSEGPDLRSITFATKQGLTFKFHGEGVVQIFWWVYSPTIGKVMRSGLVNPQENTIKITFETLPGGEYSLGIAGTKCIGSDTRSFTIK